MGVAGGGGTNEVERGVLGLMPMGVERCTCRFLHGSPKRYHTSWIWCWREIRKFDLLLRRLLICDVLELALGQGLPFRGILAGREVVLELLGDGDRSHQVH